MKRKVVQHGSSSLTVTLPNKWIKKFNVKKGDEVDIEESTNCLTISHKKEKVLEKIELELLSGHSWYINHIIRHVYVAGYDELIIKTTDKSMIIKVNDAIDSLPGFELMDIKADRLIIKCLYAGKEEEFENLVRKIFLLTFNLFELLINDLKKGKDLNKEESQNIRKSISKFCNLSRRIETKYNMYDTIINRAIHIIITRLYMISNNINDIYLKLGETKKTQEMRIAADYCVKVYSLYKLFYEAFYDHDTNRLLKLNTIRGTREELVKRDLANILEKESGCVNVICHYLGEIARIIGACVGHLLILEVKKE